MHFEQNKIAQKCLLQLLILPEKALTNVEIKKKHNVKHTQSVHEYTTKKNSISCLECPVGMLVRHCIGQK